MSSTYNCFDYNNLSSAYRNAVAMRELDAVKAGINRAFAEKQFQQSQYLYYKAASISCQSPPASPTYSTEHTRSAANYSQSCNLGEQRFTRLIV
jgi:hypothetical protein